MMWRVWRWRGGVPIFWQTLILLVGSLIVLQAVIIAIIVLLPEPRSSFISMTGIATELETPGRLQRTSTHDLLALLPMTIDRAPPPQPRGMATDERLTRELARRLLVAPDRVRLYYAPEQGRYFALRQQGEAVPSWQGEALFFNRVVASLRTPHGWRTLRTAEPPWVGEWQQRSILIIGASFLILLFSSWFFARRLSRPIRQFAVRADRMGRDMGAPRVPVVGPSELRTTAIALNGMHDRIDTFLRERMAMSAAIAHDLRTPLARIAFRVEAAPDGVREPVMRDIEQMQEMIGATLAFVKEATAQRHMESCDIAALLEELAEESRDIGQDVTLASVTSAAVIGDPVALRRMIQNLIDNAVAYGGRAHLDMTVQGGTVKIGIEDAGPGLPEAMLESVFDPFVRHEPSRNRGTGGVGLGLTIARSIASDHDGALALRNRPEGGLAAVVTLPLAGKAKI